VLAGGLWQALLVVSSWAVDRGSAERTAISDSFLALSGYASDLAAGSLEPPGAATGASRQVLRDPNPLMRNAARLQLLELAEEAERIRASLSAVGVGRAASGDGQGGQRLLACSAGVLNELAGALASRPGQRAGHLHAARRQLRSAAPASDTPWEWAGETLLGQLRAACRITQALNEAEPAGAGRGKAAMRRSLTTRQTLLALRAGMGMSSETGRHALRLAVMTAVAEVIVRAAGLPHGYWGVLTVFIVLRPDYSSTLYRGLQRAAGTVVGAGLGVATVQLRHLGLDALLVGIAVCLLAAYAVFTVNYLLYAVFLTDFVVVLLDLLGLPPETTAIDRLIGTGVGTGLALLAYVVWPTWEGTSASEKFARLFAAQGSYASAMLRDYTRSGERGVTRRRDLQLAAHRARLDAEASTDRLAGEPEHLPMTAELAGELIAVGHRIAQACIALGAAVSAHETAAASARSQDARLQPQLDALAGSVSAATGQLADAARDLGAPGPHLPRSPFPKLRAQQRDLLPPAEDDQAADDPATIDAEDLTGPGGEAAGLLAATDSLVDAIETGAEILRHPEQAA
jgi:uncharacterized membrane protein YccC